MAVLRIRRCGLAVVVMFLVAACSGSTDSTAPDPTDPNPDPAPDPVVLSGSVGDGPAVEATLTVTDAAGNVLQEQVSDELAGYELSLPGDTDLPVLISATGGTDLVTGRPLDFTLVGAALLPGTSTVNVSPLTTLAVRAAQCSTEGLTVEGLEQAWQRVHDELGMGMDARAIPDPMTAPVTRDNIEMVVLANEALGEAVRRAEQALAGTGSSVDADAVVRQLACDLVDQPGDRDGTTVEPRVVAAFKAAELAVRLEAFAGRLEVDGTSATVRMNDAIRLVMRDFTNPSVTRVQATDAAREQTLALVSLLREEAGSDALLTLAAALERARPEAVRSVVDTALSAALHVDLQGLAANLALADDTALEQLAGRRADQETAPRPLVSLGADAGRVAPGGRVTLSWASSDAEQCVSSWAGAVAAEGAMDSVPLATSTTFSLSCVGLGGMTTGTVDVLVGDTPLPEPEPEPEPEPVPGPDPQPTLSLSAANGMVNAGASTTLTWVAANASTCLANGGWSGLKAASDSENVGPLNATTTFRLTCTGTGGTVSRSVTVQVEGAGLEPAPTVNLQAAAGSVQNGAATQLSWTSSNATACTAAGGWSGGRATSGSQSTGSLAATTTFQLTCEGQGGSATDSVTIQVAAPNPSVSLNASAYVVDPDETVTLTWTSSGADTCSAGLGWSGSKPRNGSDEVGPLTGKTSFRLTCSRGGVHAPTTIAVAVNGSVALEWEPPVENEDGSVLTDLAGYRVYYGTRSRGYDEQLEVSSAGVTSTSLTLPSGTYYFAMTALDKDGNESAYSNEVVRTVD